LVNYNEGVGAPTVALHPLCTRGAIK